MGLSTRDLDAAHELTLEAHGCRSVAAFCEHLGVGIRRLVPCDAFGYNEVDVEHRRLVRMGDEPFDPSIPARLAEIIDQHPLLPLQRAGDLRTHVLSDFISASQFHRLELYHDVYKPLGTEDQIVFGLSRRGVVAIALSRTRRSFTARDRAVVELLRPWLAQAYELVRQRERDAVLIQALEANLEQRHAAILVLDRYLRIDYCSTTAGELMSAYFPGETPGAGRLPAAVESWLGTAPARPELLVEGARGRLRIRKVPGGAGLDWCAVVLAELRANPPEAEELQALGLTRREAQVLRLVSCGKPNQQVAHELGISTATVRKHLERVYQRLGVASRTEAIARVHG